VSTQLFFTGPSAVEDSNQRSPLYVRCLMCFIFYVGLKYLLDDLIIMILLSIPFVVWICYFHSSRSVSGSMDDFAGRPAASGNTVSLFVPFISSFQRHANSFGGFLNLVGRF
jgi:hypothetical protein